MGLEGKARIRGYGLGLFHLQAVAFGWTLNLSELSALAWLWLMAALSQWSCHIPEAKPMVVPLLSPGMGTRQLRNIRDYGAEFSEVKVAQSLTEQAWNPHYG